MCFVEVIASGISAISVLALLIAILRNPKVRSNTFNLYLVFCLAPDAVYSLLTTFVTVRYLVEYRWARATGEWRTTPPMLDIMEDHFLTWCENFWFCASLWMSFSVFVQIYKLLTANKRVKRYQPPTRKRVIRDSTIILIISLVIGASIELLGWWLYEYGYGRDDDDDDDDEVSWSVRGRHILDWVQYIPVLFLPTLLITGMCFGVWWNKLLPRKNARYRSLTMFFARLLASAYLMVIGAVTKQLIYLYWPEEGEDKLKVFATYSYFIFYLFGFFQVCLALTKKDIRDAFVEMWCCRGIGVRSSAATSPPTAEESYEPDGYDGEPAIVDNATSSAVNSILLNQDDVPNENDGNEGSTSFVDNSNSKQNESSIIENEGSVVDDINGERSKAENLSDIDEANNEIAMSKEDKNSVQV